jgi:hypothetical protein
VLKRLRAKAEKQIPLKTRDWLAEFVWLPVYGTFLWLWLPLGLALFNWKRVGDFVLFILWVIGAAAIPLILTLLLTSKLKAPRNAKIANCTIQLALERQEEIVETERFYASAEWKNARQVVIRDQGSVCKKCGKSIRNQLNVTVDHIKPRKKFPSLALELSNLQVLCRSCNSAKGARFIEIDN